MTFLIPEKILFLKYEELKNDPVRILKRLEDFLGHGFSEQEVKDRKSVV